MIIHQYSEQSSILTLCRLTRFYEALFQILNNFQWVTFWCKNLTQVYEPGGPYSIYKTSWRGQHNNSVDFLLFVKTKVGLLKLFFGCSHTMWYDRPMISSQVRFISPPSVIVTSPNGWTGRNLWTWANSVCFLIL